MDSKSKLTSRLRKNHSKIFDWKNGSEVEKKRKSSNKRDENTTETLAEGLAFRMTRGIRKQLHDIAQEQVQQDSVEETIEQEDSCSSSSSESSDEEFIVSKIEKSTPKKRGRPRGSFKKRVSPPKKERTPSGNKNRINRVSVKKINRNEKKPPEIKEKKVDFSYKHIEDFFHVHENFDHRFSNLPSEHVQLKELWDQITDSLDDETRERFYKLTKGQFLGRIVQKDYHNFTKTLGIEKFRKTEKFCDLLSTMTASAIFEYHRDQFYKYNLPSVGELLAVVQLRVLFNGFPPLTSSASFAAVKQLNLTIRTILKDAIESGSTENLPKVD